MNALLCERMNLQPHPLSPHVKGIEHGATQLLTRSWPQDSFCAIVHLPGRSTGRKLLNAHITSIFVCKQKKTSWSFNFCLITVLCVHVMFSFFPLPEKVVYNKNKIGKKMIFFTLYFRLEFGSSCHPKVSLSLSMTSQ